MAIPSKGELDTPATSKEIRDRIVQDIRLGYERLGQESPDVSPGTYVHNFSSAIAELGFTQYANIALSADNTDVLTATGDALDSIRDARGLAELSATGSSGKVTVTVLGGGSAGFADGDELVLSNGLRLAVNGTQTGITDGDTINVAATDTGSDTNADSGDEVRFVDPPLNVQTTATVAVGGLTGGKDEESDEEKRARILNKLRNVPGGANWSHIVAVADDASAAVQQPFVYPALGGPSSAKLVLTSALSIAGDSQSYSREVTSTVIDTVTTAIQDEIGTAFEISIQSVVDEPIDITLKLKLPTDGSGFVNGDNAWPPLTGSEEKITVSAKTDTTNITVDATETGGPTDGTTEIAWFSPHTREFVSAKITSSSGSAGAWVLTLDTPLIDGSGNEVSTGDFICPKATNQDNYRDTFLTSMNALGPGENKELTSEDETSKRKGRRPITEDGWPFELTNLQLSELIAGNSDIRDADYVHQSKTTPTIPGDLSTAPNILALRSFAIYPRDL